uniref:Uncharacterized protein n=1 Tax=Arundo donax TaxID=35708 RepID=A0A0A9HDI8_ARUDO
MHLFKGTIRHKLSTFSCILHLSYLSCCCLPAPSVGFKQEYQNMCLPRF